MISKFLRGVAVACLLAALPLTPLAAEQVRFRYVPVDASGNLTQVPAGPNGRWANNSPASASVPRRSTAYRGQTRW